MHLNVFYGEGLKMKKQITIVILIITSFLFTWLFIIQKRESGLNPCSAYMVIYKNNLHFNALIEFISFKKDGTGVLTLSGTSFINEKKTGVVRRVIEYSWDNTGGTYTFTSSAIRKSPRDETLSESTLKDFLPSFFSEVNGNLNLSVTPQGNAGYLFASGSRPLFFCEKLQYNT